METTVDSQREQRLTELRDAFHQEPLAQDALKTLLRLKARGCDPQVVLAYAGRVAGYKNVNIVTIRRNHGNAPQIPRRIRAIARQLKKLAKQTKELSQMWGLWSRMVDGGCIHVPEELEAIADRLLTVRVKGYADWNPHREALRDLLEHVKSSTGRYQYAEVSLLINGEICWWALKQGNRMPELRYDVDSLKMMVQRWKKEDREKSLKECASSAKRI